MTIKVFLNSDHTATFVCPDCQKTRLADVSQFIATKSVVRLKAKCACGHAYKVFIDKRKKFRKQTRLTGTYKYASQESLSKEYTGDITVENLSHSGIRVKLHTMPRFKVDDILLIDFHLDDSNRSKICEKVIVRNIKGLYAGLEYVALKSLNKDLGFYLFQ